MNIRYPLYEGVYRILTEQFDRGFDTLQMFTRLEGINGDTIVRGFCSSPEIRLGDLLPSSL